MTPAAPVLGAVTLQQALAWVGLTYVEAVRLQEEMVTAAAEAE